MDINKTKTHRGFDYNDFKDRDGVPCSIQESSLASEEAIWFGINDANPRIMESKVKKGGIGWIKYPIIDDVLFDTRMHLTREQVKELLPILERFVETGNL